MQKVKIKKTFDLHKYNLKFNNIIPDIKIVIPVISTFIGIISGALFGKGESGLYYKLCEFVDLYILKNTNDNIYESFIIYLLVPTVISILIFFNGLSVYGSVTACLFPLIYSALFSAIIYHLYNVFSLKGLAYIVIIQLPYVILSLYALILIATESINMSGYLVNVVSKFSSNTEYNFTNYCRNVLKSYVLVIVSVIVKLVMDNLFIDLFIF